MRRSWVGLLVALTLSGSVGCGAAIPLPVPATPTAAEAQQAPRPEPPPSHVVEVEEAGGVCAHHDLAQFAAFHGHYNADDLAHYHGWQPPMGKVFWVAC